MTVSRAERITQPSPWCSRLQAAHNCFALNVCFIISSSYAAKKNFPTLTILLVHIVTLHVNPHTHSYTMHANNRDLLIHGQLNHFALIYSNYSPCLGFFE